MAHIYLEALAVELFAARLAAVASLDVRPRRRDAGGGGGAVMWLCGHVVDAAAVGDLGLEGVWLLPHDVVGVLLHLCLVVRRVQAPVARALVRAVPTRLKAMAVAAYASPRLSIVIIISSRHGKLTGPARLVTYRWRHAVFSQVHCGRSSMAKRDQKAGRFVRI